MARQKRTDRSTVVEHTLTIRLTSSEKEALEQYAKDVQDAMGGGISVTMGGVVRTLLSALPHIPAGKFTDIVRAFGRKEEEGT
jgi:hypothetical protein